MDMASQCGRAPEKLVALANARRIQVAGGLVLTVVGLAIATGAWNQ